PPTPRSATPITRSRLRDAALGSGELRECLVAIGTPSGKAALPGDGGDDRRQCSRPRRGGCCGFRWHVSAYRLPLDEPPPL
ncbi:hypothetical protein, partial [Micromonospora sp. CPCC 206061]|uniref:hypothetical protein n=1 Tax=Micromonospora sp. CPCC 206061 TaxID=3122410 RepID=UPI002FF05AA4